MLPTLIHRPGGRWVGWGEGRGLVGGRGREKERQIGTETWTETEIETETETETETQTETAIDQEKDEMAGRDRKEKGEGLDKKLIERNSIDDGQRETGREETTSGEGGGLFLLHNFTA